MHPRCPAAAAAVAVAAAVAAAVALSSPPARADPGDWYGYQVAAADVVGWGLIVGGVKADVWQVSALGLGAITLGGPIVHVGHGNYGRAGVSVGLRVGLPLLGIGLGAALDGKSRSFIPAGPVIGALLGYVAAAIVDIAIVAHEDDAPAAARVLSIGGRF